MLIVSLECIGGAQLEHVLVVCGVVGGCQTGNHVSAGSRTTQVKRLELRLTALTKSQPGSDATL